MNGIIGRKPWSLAMAALVAVLLALALGVIVAGAQPTAAFAEPDGAQLTTQANSDETQDMYRLYNPNSGEHFYTASATEKDGLVAAGWNYEGVGWYSDDRKRRAVLRAYNPNAVTGTHHYTDTASERDGLVRAGWRNEGTGWYAAGAGRADSLPLNFEHYKVILSTAATSGAVTVTRGNVAPAALSAINGYLVGNDTPIGFIALNARTGACITRNADMRIFGASAVKAPYTAALCKYNAPDLAGAYSAMYNAVTYSSNSDFYDLNGWYGKGYLATFASDCGIALDFKYSEAYADLTPRELCLLWTGIRDYLISNGPNVELHKSLYGNGAFFKDGWMYPGTWCGMMYHTGGIQGDVVYAIMTRYGKPSDVVTGLRDSLIAALS